MKVNGLVHIAIVTDVRFLLPVFKRGAGIVSFGSQRRHTWDVHVFRWTYKLCKFSESRGID